MMSQKEKLTTSCTRRFSRGSKWEYSAPSLLTASCICNKRCCIPSIYTCRKRQGTKYTCQTCKWFFTVSLSSARSFKHSSSQFVNLLPRETTNMGHFTSPCNTLYMSEMFWIVSPRMISAVRGAKLGEASDPMARNSSSTSSLTGLCGGVCVWGGGGAHKGAHYYINIACLGGKCKSFPQNWAECLTEKHPPRAVPET